MAKINLLRCTHTGASGNFLGNCAAWCARGPAFPVARGTTSCDFADRTSPEPRYPAPPEFQPVGSGPKSIGLRFAIGEIVRKLDEWIPLVERWKAIRSLYRLWRAIGNGSGRRTPQASGFQSPRFMNQLFAQKKDTKMTLLQLMLIPSAAGGLVLVASMIMQRVRHDW